MARGSIDVTVEIDGIKQLDRDLKRLHPAVQRQLKGDLKDIAQGVAREATRKSGAHSFSYRGASTGRSASVRSTGQRAFVARFLEFGFHPRGGSTLVEGRNIVGRVIADREQEIIDDIGDSIDRAARRAGWH